MHYSNPPSSQPGRTGRRPFDRAAFLSWERDMTKHLGFVEVENDDGTFGIAFAGSRDRETRYAFIYRGRGIQFVFYPHLFKRDDAGYDIRVTGAETDKQSMVKASIPLSIRGGVMADITAFFTQHNFFFPERLLTPSDQRPTNILFSWRVTS